MQTTTQLNLLPKNEREELKIEFNIRFLKFFGISIFTILLISAALLFIIYWGLKIQTSSNEKSLEITQAGESGKKIIFMEQKIREINNRTNRINQIQNSLTDPLLIFYRIISIIPEGIILKNMDINFEKKEVNAAGHADLRENLITFQDNLEKSDFAENISRPLSDLLKQKNINFNINFKLK